MSEFRTQAPIVTTDPDSVNSQGHEPTALCKNCGAALAGRYCANCGQAAYVHVPSVREVMHEVVEGVTHADSRLWRTLLSLWFRPGKLTEEFFAGRRVAYLPPFRLYLIVSVVFFLIVSSSHDAVLYVTPSGTAAARAPAADGSSCDDAVSYFGMEGHPDWQGRMKRACIEIRRDNGVHLQKVLLAALPKAMFVFLPLIAFLHMLLYWRPRRGYAAHLLFFLHLQAYFFSIGILMMLIDEPAQRWPQLATASSIFDIALGATLPVYTVVAMRRVFNNGWPVTLAKALALFLAYLLIWVITWTTVFFYAALQL